MKAKDVTKLPAVSKVTTGRKRVDLLPTTHAGFEVVWLVIRQLRTFTCTALICEIVNKGFKDCNDLTVKSYLQRLHKGCYIEIIDKENVNIRGNVERYTYTLQRDIGVHAPKLTKTGQPSKRGRGQEHMWRTIKILGEFDYRDLALAASTADYSIKPNTAQDYVKHLAKAGYLHCTQTAKTGCRLARYRLLPSKDTGPRPIQVQRIKQVFDPNLDEVVWSENMEACA